MRWWWRRRRRDAEAAQAAADARAKLRAAQVMTSAVERYARDVQLPVDEFAARVVEAFRGPS